MQVLREIFYPLPQQALREAPPMNPARMLQILKITGIFLGFVPLYLGLRDSIGSHRAFAMGVGAATFLSRTIVKYFTRAMEET